MGYVYAVMWLIIAYFLIFRLSKESKFFYLLGGFFVVMSGWWFVDTMYPDLGMLEGDLSWILRGLGAVVCALTIVFYYKKVRGKS